MKMSSIFVPTDETTQKLINTQTLCAQLMRTPHYAKLGSEGIFAVVSAASTLGIDPFTALDGGLYYVKGKVEMSARTMNGLIRSKKHSITKDKKSDDTICILHGKRSDNGDTWTESFSWAEAVKAGLDKNPVWKNYTRDMLFARALSRLARQLFPDIIGNVYVEGEITYDHTIQEKVTNKTASQINQIVNIITDEQYGILMDAINVNSKYKMKVEEFLAKQNIVDLKTISINLYERIVKGAEKEMAELTPITSVAIVPSVREDDITLQDDTTLQDETTLEEEAHDE
jgi:hypothetical protein